MMYPAWLGQQSTSVGGTADTYQATHGVTFSVSKSTLHFSLQPANISFSLLPVVTKFTTTPRQYSFSSTYFINGIPGGTL